MLSNSLLLPDNADSQMLLSINLFPPLRFPSGIELTKLLHVAPTMFSNFRLMAKKLFKQTASFDRKIKSKI